MLQDQDFTFHYIPSDDSGIDLAWTDDTIELCDSKDVSSTSKPKRVTFNTSLIWITLVHVKMKLLLFIINNHSYS